MSTSSSSSVWSSSWSRAFVVYVVCSFVVGWVVVIVEAEAVGRAGFLNLSFMKLAFHEITFRVLCRCGEPRHVAGDVVVVSVGSVRL